ncbi:MAG: hypothetical protein ACOWWR_17165 [Eubacteriales bacterium]
MNNWNFQEYDDEDLKVESGYLAKLFDNIFEGCNILFENITQTEQEYTQLPFFTRSKGLKYFEKTNDISFKELKDHIVSIQKLFRDIQEDIQIRNYDKLNNHLRTYYFTYSPIVQKFTRIEKYFEDVPEFFQKKDKSNSKYSEFVNQYERRKNTIHHLHKDLNKIYALLSIE